MKQIPIDECPAGSEIDAAVAKLVGWLYCPSANIAAAWELVEELYQQIGEWISIARDAKGNYWAGVIGAVSDYDWWEYSSKADTAPLAITRAYLKAKGIEFVEVEE